jgi:uncharacterized membrane protein
VVKELFLAFLVGFVMTCGLFWIAGVDFTQRGGELAFCVMIGLAVGVICAVGHKTWRFDLPCQRSRSGFSR